MALRLSKRLVRFTLMVGGFLILLITLSSHSSTKEYMPQPLDISSFSTPLANFGNSISNTILDAAGMEAESQRMEAESNAEVNGEKVLTGDEIPDDLLDEQAKALKDTANAAGIEDMSKSVMDFIKPSFENRGNRPKACFVTLVRNSELDGIVKSIRKVQERFNKQFMYDWVFLNDEEFTENFKETILHEIPTSVVKFGVIPKEHWSYPDYIDQSKAADTRIKMADIIYGASESYRHMCRFQSGFFWRHKLLDDYDWYWRVEPDINLYCDIKYDVFKWMQDNEKVYGFTITIHEYLATIPTLWKTSMDFFKKHPEYVDKDNLMEFISGDKGEHYNLCHFWSNFEIANLNLWRSPAYTEYFDALDHAGGFFYERWGDAPVHSIAASILLPKDKIHYFSNIGYHHPPYDNCPIDDRVWAENNCDCQQKNDFTFKGYACGKEYYAAQKMDRPPNWEEYSH
ncbi:similar to Saccharomyces cerevisiae YDR483W KRE2 Alpha1,2- mannosyltransferase of the Golgi involved in protein mannosylation [Maudiozyma barnettii]|uniref:Similar to Saccharomyces cerevisiae YDR483W KRE2 Alpha1,2- mannosyltransferase of the Golgi involved in protein mannosylation n=1 Tax=Maudiozyma barnettii TaxID=61262 RepID=A0A8H2VGI8_9SACH|nr:alpha-1,2-mannosyltransferase KRE2 [Kazachstania barnettii]CAB4255060.1 similar to Saccharomyces cerevisiae YDR483W KRE2 Alpha1,2- mannosyltransferase of the Golgi involved in protein mannosylation [Kazachstania barnettii]CAD1783331.1 similar to Saccharomyces cerevisiae YDR483W KRE2 Alpha1,2- mannosyltransferase of the Golgi involved in protein mannosylation [Kazachstania barnettii]